MSVFTKISHPAKAKGSARPFVAMLCAQMSTASTEQKPQQISRNLSFRPATDSPVRQEQRPLALIYGWLVAKARHIHKYGDFYLGKGFDVLHIKVEPLQLAWPKNAQGVAQQVLDFVTEATRANQPLVVHGFSVGGYLFGETLVKIMQDPVLQRQVGQRLKGQIFDSAVDFEGVPRGMSHAVASENLIVQKLLKGSLTAHLKLFPNKVMKHYLTASSTFHENPLSTPSLMLYSNSDPIGIASSQEIVMDKWKKKGIPVFSKCWGESPHVQHFTHHPVEYIGMLNAFLTQIGLARDIENKMKQSSFTMSN